MPRSSVACLAVVAIALAHDAAEVRAAYPGADGRIVFETSASGGAGSTEQLWTIDANGANPGPLLGFTPPGASLGEPRWSPNGHQVACLQTGSGSSLVGLTVVMGDGLSFSTLLLFSVGDPEHARPSWSPDGRKIAYAASDGLHVVDVATKKTSRLLADTSSITYDEPAWSPDGSRIAFRITETGVGPYGVEHDIGVVSAKGGSVVNLTRNPADLPGRDAGSPDWAPGGATIAFQRGDEARPQNDAAGQPRPLPSTVMQVDVVSRAVSEVVHAPAGSFDSYYHPAYSPDGTEIVAEFRSDAVVSGFGVMNANGTDFRLFKDGDGFAVGGVFPDWQPIASSDVIALTLDPSHADFTGTAVHGRVAADGYQASHGTATLVDSAGAPLAGFGVLVRPNVLADPLTSSDPRFLVCDEKGALLWPGRTLGGALDFLDTPSIETDSQGRGLFRVLAGSQPAADLLFDVTETGYSKVTTGEFQDFTTAAAAPLPPNATFVDAMDLQLNGATARFVPSAAGSAAQKQDTLLEWLDQLRWTAVNDPTFDPTFQKIEFAPIRSAAGGHAGIVFYPRNSSPNPLLEYMRSGPTPGDPRSWYVLDVDDFRGPDSNLAVAALPTLADWETRVGSNAQPGRLEPWPDEDLMYFGWPYPPPDGIVAASLARGLYARAIRVKGMEAIAHSPVNLLFTDAQSRSIGIDAAGRRHLDLPGVIVAGKGANPGGYVLPADAYTVTLTGTGAGPATVAFGFPAADGPAPTVFTLRSARGATGTVAVDAASGPASQANFGGTNYVAQAGVALVCTRVAKTLKAGKRVKLTVVAKDPWRKPVSDAVATFAAGLFTARATTDAKGRATLALSVPTTPGAGTLTVSAPGFADSVQTFNVK